MPRLAANLTLLFTELPFMERFAAAARAGFSGVVSLLPYTEAPAEVVRDALQRHQLHQVLFNLPAGDWAAGERGIACLPERVDEYRAGVERVLPYAHALGCTQLNCLAGLCPDGIARERLEDTLRENLRWTAQRLANEGIRLMVEAINSKIDMPGFLLDTSARTLDLIDSVGEPNLFMQYDLYHMQIMEGDLLRTLQTHLSRIGHIQFADNPGRHEPGTGEINIARIFDCLDQWGYAGWVSAEYRPLGTTEISLEALRPWLAPA
ncbi:MAG: hydroxypyruvate isomerase family protein [Gammaproteobacteria bacterium]|nr:hydroxypyruvate isomerase family protein [Gammaproteobacteria bacterium]